MQYHRRSLFVLFAIRQLIGGYRVDVLLKHRQITTHKLIFSVSRMGFKLHICKLEIPNKQQILIRATDRLKLEAKKCSILIAEEK